MRAKIRHLQTCHPADYNKPKHRAIILCTNIYPTTTVEDVIDDIENDFNNMDHNCTGARANAVTQAFRDLRAQLSSSLTSVFDSSIEATDPRVEKPRKNDVVAYFEVEFIEDG